MTLIEYIFIAFLVGIQLFVFLNVRTKIITYKNFFPSSFDNLSVKKFHLSTAQIKSRENFNSFLETLNNEDKIEILEEENNESIELLVMPKNIEDSNKEFSNVIKSTNAYLSKNKGASADFNILQDICERHLQKLDNSIGNLINVPLYLGLGGTFIGIIIGLWGIKFSGEIEGSAIISTSSIDQLLNGVIAAMIASLFGLFFTVWNTAKNYKPAAFKNETDKNNYYDFIQRELLPVLNVSMAGSLIGFRSVLDHFIMKFGENINDYKYSAELLNNNLHSQHLVLEEINKLSIVKTSNKIAEAFVNLKESSEHLVAFKEYQKGLNESMLKTQDVMNDINTTIVQYKDFNSNLKIIAANTITSFELQKQFKESLEKHFPVIEDHREVWRKQIDELNNDIKDVYKELNEYFKVSTSQIQSFINDNNNFFAGINEIRSSIKLFAENSSIQNEQFKLLHNTITEMRNDMRDSQRQAIETNQEIISVLKSFKKEQAKLSITED